MKKSSFSVSHIKKYITADFNVSFLFYPSTYTLFLDTLLHKPIHFTLLLLNNNNST